MSLTFPYRVNRYGASNPAAMYSLDPTRLGYSGHLCERSTLRPVASEERVDEFRVSSFSGGGNCVEVRDSGDGLHTVRHSKGPDRELTFTRAEWDAFVKGVKAGEFDPQ